jgi:hypothetical protein
MAAERGRRPPPMDFGSSPVAAPKPAEAPAPTQAPSPLPSLSIDELRWLETELTWMKTTGLELHSDRSALPAEQRERADALERWWAARWNASAGGAGSGAGA